MKKDQKLNNEELIAKLYANSFLQLRDSTLTIIDFYDKKSTFLLEKLYELKNNEPWKILKKTHKEWEETIQKIDEEYKITFDKYLKECQELEEIMKLAKIENQII